jgi:hypothetical protein
VTTARSSPEVLHVVTPIFVLDICDCLLEHDTMTIAVRDILIETLGHSFRVNRSDDAFVMILYILKRRCAVPHEPAFLRFLVALIEMDSSLQPRVVAAILEATELLTRPEPEIQMLLMKILEDKYEATVDALVCKLQQASELPLDENSA